MAKRPSLSDLATKKPGEMPASMPDVATTDDTVKEKRAGAQPDGRKGVLVRVEVAGWRQLRDLAAELTETTGDQHSMQSLIVEQINRLLKEHNRPPVA